jgi:hypothetical protein
MDKLTADWLANAPPPAAPGSRFVSGLDLGQLKDHSALAVDEVTEATEDGKTVRNHFIRSLHRWPLRTPYEKVVDDVVRV